MKAYICITIPKSPGNSQTGWFGHLLQRLLPAANPHFERLYEHVVMWHVEIDALSGEPLREIGLGAQQNVLAIGPWRDNHGFIVDCGGTFVPAEHRQISAEQFEEEWKSFDSRQVTS